MAQLAAEGVLDTPHIPDLSSAQPEQAPPAEEAIGGRVTIHFAGVGVWCRGKVLAYSAAKQVRPRIGMCPKPIALHPISGSRSVAGRRWHTVQPGVSGLACVRSHVHGTAPPAIRVSRILPCLGISQLAWRCRSSKQMWSSCPSTSQLLWG